LDETGRKRQQGYEFLPTIQEKQTAGFFFAGVSKFSFI